jgi:hypothetical protein
MLVIYSEKFTDMYKLNRWNIITQEIEGKVS